METEDLFDQIHELEAQYFMKNFSMRGFVSTREKIIKLLDDSRPVQAGVIKKNADEIKKLFKEAYDDMTVIYAPDCVGDESVKELSDKIRKVGKGTLGYIDTKYQEAIKKIESIFSL